jgi:hypothetical protein
MQESCLKIGHQHFLEHPFGFLTLVVILWCITSESSKAWTELAEESCCAVVGTPALYSRRSFFESRPQYRLWYVNIYVVFLCSFILMQRHYIKTGHDRFLSHLFESFVNCPKHHSMKTFWERRYSSMHSLTSALDGGELSASRPGQFTPRERASSTHWIGGWVGPRAGLDTVSKKILSPRRESNTDHPVVQSVASRYTDWTILAHDIYLSQLT